MSDEIMALYAQLAPENQEKVKAKIIELLAGEERSTQ